MFEIHKIWLEKFLIKLVDQSISSLDANKAITEKYLYALNRLNRFDSVVGTALDDKGNAVSSFAPLLRTVYLTNKIVEIIRNEKSYDPIISEECIRKSYTTLLEYYKDPTNPYSRPVDWVHGIDPELSKHYRNLVNHPSSLKS